MKKVMTFFVILGVGMFCGRLGCGSATSVGGKPEPHNKLEKPKDFKQPAPTGKPPAGEKAGEGAKPPEPK